MVRVLLLSTPSYGFGDVLYCMKLYKYLRQWYRYIDIDIATTQIKKVKQLDLRPRKLYSLTKSDEPEVNLKSMRLYNQRFRSVKPAPYQYVFILYITILTNHINMLYLWKEIGKSLIPQEFLVMIHRCNYLFAKK
jgi:hypothetical protein